MHYKMTLQKLNPSELAALRNFSLDYAICEVEYFCNATKFMNVLPYISPSARRRLRGVMSRISRVTLYGKHGATDHQSL